MPYDTGGSLVANLDAVLATLLPQGASSGESTFDQTLQHNHANDDPTWALGNGPESYGHIAQVPGSRRWVGDTPAWAYGGGWAQYNFSWIVADHRVTPGGKTSLAARFITQFRIEFNGFACLEVTSKATAGFGSAMRYMPAEGYFRAVHKVCIKSEPPSSPRVYPGLFTKETNAKHHEMWRMTFRATDNSVDPQYPVWSEGPNDTDAGPWYGDSEIVQTVAICGPAEVQVSEQVIHEVDLTEGALIIPHWPLSDPGSNVGLFGEFEPLFWRLKSPSCGLVR